jgi:divalent metal cation (Fe/Co/Zn/Cd) transporter
MKIAAKKADEKHPYGYYSAEAIVSGIGEATTTQILSTFSSIFEEIKNFVSNAQNKEFLFLIFVFIFGLLVGFFLSKKRKKVKSKF